MASGGYLWWYVDALSDDGEHALTIIAFVGSVFSPYYRWALRGGAAQAQNHCAINVALYGRAGKRWAMTERSAASVQRATRSFTVGPSSVHWRDDALVIDFDEIGLPLPRRVRGRVVVHPQGLGSALFALDDNARHHWGPIAPCARVEVQLTHPGLRWQGHAYLDANEGVEPVDRAFHEWDWSRAGLRDGSCGVVYDVRQKQGADRVLALRFAADGQATPFEPPPRQALPRTAWFMNRHVRTEAEAAGAPGAPGARVQQTLEDTPFYVRSVLNARLLGEPVVALHETLHVPRLVSTAVQCMLPWRMPRVR